MTETSNGPYAALCRFWSRWWLYYLGLAIGFLVGRLW